MARRCAATIFAAVRCVPAVSDGLGLSGWRRCTSGSDHGARWRGNPCRRLVWWQILCSLIDVHVLRFVVMAFCVARSDAARAFHDVPHRTLPQISRRLVLSVDSGKRPRRAEHAYVAVLRWVDRRGVNVLSVQQWHGLILRQGVA